MSGTSIEHRALKNTAVGVLAFLVTLGQTIVLVPILLEHWGNTRYGLWLTLMAAFSLLQTLDLGHQTYVGNRLNMEYHTSPERFQRSLGSGVIVACFLGLMQLVIAVVVVSSGALPNVIGVSPEVAAAERAGMGLLVLMAMWVTFGSVGGLIVRMLTPIGMLYQAQWFGIAFRLTQFLSVIMAVLWGQGILMASVFYAISQAGMSLVLFRYVRRKVPQFYPWWHGASLRAGLLALRNSLVLTANSIAQQLLSSGLVLLVSALFAAAVVPLFATLRTLTNTAVALATVFVTALFPDMIRFQATRQAEKLADVFSTNWIVSGAFVNGGLLLVLPVVEPIFRLWTRGHLAFDPVLFLALAAAVSLTNFGAGLIVYLQGINDLWAQTVITVARAGIVLVVGYLLSGPLGLLAIGIGCIVAEAVGSMLLPVVYVNKRMREMSSRLPPGHVVLASIPPVMLVLAFGALALTSISLQTLAFILLPAMAGIYLLSWRSLSTEVRSRIWSLASALSRLKAG